MKHFAWMTLATLTVSMTAACSSSQQRPAQAASLGCAQLGSAAESPFYKSGQVYSARPIERTQVLARAHQPRRTVGAELYVHAQPGLTKEYLQRSLECHRVAGQPAHPSDPLHPQNGSVDSVAVRSVGSSFAVSVYGDSPETGREIWQRAQSFAGSSDVTVEQLASADEPIVN